MNFAVLYSKKDEAGINIAEQLKKLYLPQVQIIELKKDSIYSENIDEKESSLKNVDLIIFATKHQSKEERKTFSLHAPGNWRSQKSVISDDSQKSEGFLKNADLGGKPGKICKTSALALKFLFQKLNENLNQEKEKNSECKDYETTLECTHHGPYLETKPCLFIEIGTTINQWQDKKAASIIAKTISDFQNFKPSRELKTAIFIGGHHYCSNANKIQLSNISGIAISHIIPEYALPLNESMLKEAIEKTQEHVDLILIDWKGCGNSESRNKVIEIIEKLGLKYERTERIEK